MSGGPTDPTDIVWRPIEDYELRIQGGELSAVLQTFAHEYEKGRGAYVLENLLDAVHFRLGQMLVHAVADALREPCCATNPIAPAMPAESKSLRVIRPFAGAGIEDAMNANRGEFYLSLGSGDEFFEVINDKDETIRSGAIVRVGRGNRVRVGFNARSMSAHEASEHGKQYAWSGVVHVDEDGCLVLPNQNKYPADGALIEIYPQNGNSVRFGRTED